MSVGRRPGLAIALACLGLGMAGGGYAHAAPAEIVAADRCCTFIDGPFSQPAGDRALFRNPGSPNTAPHNVSSDGRGPDGGPLFYSRVISPGVTVEVKGTEYLDPGTYGFVCDLHSEMVSSLQVTEGTAATRPRVATQVTDQSLRLVRRTGRVVLTLRSATATGPVSVRLRVSRELVGNVRVDKLKAGKTTRISVRLNRRGIKAIAKGSSVRFEATSVPEFGIPQKGYRVIRSRGPK